MLGSESIEDQRRIALERLQQLRGFYDNPEGAQLLTQIQQRASGGDQPFSGEVTAGMFGANADAASGQFGMEREAILRSMGNAGLGGSGLQANALINARRRSSAMARSGRQEITSRAALANFQAKEAAQQQLQSYLQQRQQTAAQATQQEVAFRGQMREVTDAPALPQQTAQGAAPAQQPSGNGAASWFNTGGRTPYAAGSSYVTPQFGSAGGGMTGMTSGFTSGAALNQNLFQTQAQQAMLRQIQGL